jgi:hypothetical protein
MYFFEKTCNAQKLDGEIRDSDITVALSHIEGTETSVTIFFKAALSEADESILIQIIDEHENIPLPDGPQEVKVVYDPAQRDSDGAVLSRIKMSRPKREFQIFCFELKTASLEPFCKKNDGSDIPFVSVKLLDASGEETLDPLDAVSTVVSWQTDYSFEIIGAKLFQAENPSQDVRLWVIAAPDIPHEFGGSVDHVQGGMNLRMIGKSYELDGRTTRAVDIIEGIPTNKFNFQFSHPAGFEHSCMITMEIFKDH